jgi:hypothetical protein
VCITESIAPPCIINGKYMHHYRESRGGTNILEMNTSRCCHGSSNLYASLFLQSA